MPQFPQPTLTTSRLVLRPSRPADAADIARLAGERAIAATTLLIPHPYELHMAVEWIAKVTAGWAEDTSGVFAITLNTTGEVVGSIGFKFELAHKRAELGYWIGVPYWGRGYASEASVAMLTFGFGPPLALERINAHAMASNLASCRVLEKIGMKHEGVLRRHQLKWERWEDLALYGALRDEWRAPAAAS